MAHTALTKSWCGSHTALTESWYGSQVSAEELSKAKQEVYETREELERLRKMLAEAGLSDLEVLSTLESS